MTGNNSKSYINYLNKLVDDYNNTYHRSIGKKPIDAALTEESEPSYEAPKFKVGDRARLLSTRICYTQRNICYWFCVES